MNAKHTPLEVRPDITGQDVLFNPDQDILTPIVSPSAGRAVMWVDRTPHDEMDGFADEVVRAVNAHDDLLILARSWIRHLEEELDLNPEDDIRAEALAFASAALKKARGE